MNAGRFDFYEKVVIRTTKIAKAKVNGRMGAILGKAQSDEGQWLYAVQVYDLERVWCLNENELVPTGERDRRETFFTGESIRVSPDGEILR
jgi:hypothetical protein